MTRQNNDLDKGFVLDIKKKLTKDSKKPWRLEKENFWKRHQIIQHLNQLNIKIVRSKKEYKVDLFAQD